MDLCRRFDVDGQCSLFVTGVEGIYTDDDIASVFSVNGKVSRIVRIPDESNQPEGRVLIQYLSDQAISKINPQILGDLPSPKDPAIGWSVKTIRDVAQEEVGKELARRYLEELKAVGDSGKAGFLSVIQSEVKEVRHNSEIPDTQPHTAQDGDTSLHDIVASDHDEPNHYTQTHNAPDSAVVNPVNIDRSLLNPPQIQKVVVEHVIRNDSTAPWSTQTRLRTFSGRAPRPNGEVDYETWRTQVDLLVSDCSLSDVQKVRKILESLLSPAADVVKLLGVSSPPRAYVRQLDSAFSVVEDGEELFATFLSSNQNSGEKPSAYLNRLHSLLTRAISRGGVSVETLSEHLLRQFIRGCWDQSLIIALQLENKKNSPPTFPDLLLMLRTEEGRRSAKLDRMKKHLGATKAAVHAHSIFDVPSYDDEPVPTQTAKQSEASKLERRMDELSKQVEKLSQRSKNSPFDSELSAALKQRQEETVKLESKIDELSKQLRELTQNQKCPKENNSGKDFLTARNSSARRPVKVPSMPKAWFCFRCGEDNHIAARCPNEPNQALVRQKNAELKEKQGRFQAQQVTEPFALNL